MLSKGNHGYYEQSIESVLRKSKINYIGTNEKKMGLLSNGKKLKNFDIILNSESKKTFIVDFKGKQFSYPGAVSNKWENWLPNKHAEDLIKWQNIFNKRNCKVIPLLVFLFKISNNDDKAQFKDLYSFKGTTYGVVAICPHEYLKNSKPRAKGIINVSRKQFPALAKPLSYYVPEIQYKFSKNRGKHV